MADLSCDVGTATPCIAAFAQIDDCTNEPIEGQTAYFTDGIRAVSWEPQLEEAETAVWKDNCGNIICRHEENCDQMTGLQVTLEKCVFPFELRNLLTGQPIVTDNGDVIGWYHSNQVRCQPRVAMMLWEKKLDCRNAAWRKIIFNNVRFTFPTPGAEGDLIRFHTLTARADLGYHNGYGAGPFLDDGALGWAALPPTSMGAVAEYDTDTPPPVAQCGLVTVDLTP
jgi:hypothetical protein